MKAPKAPKRIYVCDNVFPSHVDWEGSPINTKRIDNHDIEYTRTDAFIKKACEWFRRIDYDDSMPPFETTEEFIEGFKKAMKL